MKDNLKPMTLDEQKKVMLDILKAFADFCDSKNLMYYLDADTLIGAVRHKGYIPSIRKSPQPERRQLSLSGRSSSKTAFGFLHGGTPFRLHKPFRT